MRFFVLFWSCVFFSGCTSSCLSSVISLEKTFSEKEKIYHISAHGFFIEKNTVLTVSHAFPQSFVPQNFSENNRDPLPDILLLSSSRCGIPLKISKNIPEKNSLLFSCTTKKQIGTAFPPEEIIPFSLFSDHSSPKIFPFFLGKGKQGDSGTPICNASGEVIGMIVALQNEKIFFRFLSEDIFPQ